MTDFSTAFNQRDRSATWTSTGTITTSRCCRHIFDFVLLEQFEQVSSSLTRRGAVPSAEEATQLPKGVSPLKQGMREWSARRVQPPEDAASRILLYIPEAVSGSGAIVFRRRCWFLARRGLIITCNRPLCVHVVFPVAISSTSRTDTRPTSTSDRGESPDCMSATGRRLAHCQRDGYLAEYVPCVGLAARHLVPKSVSNCDSVVEPSSEASPERRILDLAFGSLSIHGSVQTWKCSDMRTFAGLGHAS